MPQKQARVAGGAHLDATLTTPLKLVGIPYTRPIPKRKAANFLFPINNLFHGMNLAFRKA